LSATEIEISTQNSFVVPAMTAKIESEGCVVVVVAVHAEIATDYA
jgi:hypothetical protein